MSALAILNVGHGNIRSVALAFERLGAPAQIVTSAEEIALARRLVIPGVGAAGQAMARLNRDGLANAIRARSGPTLGICLGMQLFFESSDEDGGTKMLGLLPGRVSALQPAPGLPVPNMGWSQLVPTMAGIGIEEGDYAWFAHGFACPQSRASAATINFGERTVPAALKTGALWGAQFHPERSSTVGARFLKAFLAS